MAPTEPYSPTEARKRVSAVLNGKGSVVPWPHAKKEMLNDRLTMLDVENTLKTGRIYEPAEERDGLWRYRMHGRNAGVVVAFTGANELSIVTVWKESNR